MKKPLIITGLLLILIIDTILSIYIFGYFTKISSFFKNDSSKKVVNIKQADPQNIINDFKIVLKNNKYVFEMTYLSSLEESKLMEILFIVRDKNETECAFKKVELSSWPKNVTLDNKADCRPSYATVAIRGVNIKNYLQVIKKEIP